jgi:hypothetical protein
MGHNEKAIEQNPSESEKEAAFLCFWGTGRILMVEGLPFPIIIIMAHSIISER